MKIVQLNQQMLNKKNKKPPKPQNEVIVNISASSDYKEEIKQKKDADQFVKDAFSFLNEKDDENGNIDVSDLSKDMLQFVLS